MSEKFLEQMEKIKNKVENMNEKDILNLLNKAFIFNEKPRIILYTKNKNKIAGYLEIDNKLLNFEIWFSTFGNTINVTIGKVSKIIKEM
jgi:inorganic pyrophosphatase/exopolyphosphatase